MTYITHWSKKEILEHLEGIVWSVELSGEGVHHANAMQLTHKYTVLKNGTEKNTRRKAVAKIWDNERWHHTSNASTVLLFLKLSNTSKQWSHWRSNLSLFGVIENGDRRGRATSGTGRRGPLQSTARWTERVYFFGNFSIRSKMIAKLNLISEYAKPLKLRRCERSNMKKGKIQCRRATINSLRNSSSRCSDLAPNKLFEAVVVGGAWADRLHQHETQHRKDFKKNTNTNTNTVGISRKKITPFHFALVWFETLDKMRVIFAIC